MKKYYGKIALGCLGIGMLAAGISEKIPSAAVAMGIVMDLAALGALVFWIVWLRSTKEERAAKQAEKKARKAEARRVKEKERAERQADLAEAKLRRMKATSEAERLMAADKRPVAAVLVATQDRYGKSVTGTAARTLLGGALFGTFGAAVGMATAQSKMTGQKATFSVKYASGRTGTETVDVGSKRFEELAKLLVK